MLSQLTLDPGSALSTWVLDTDGWLLPSMVNDSDDHWILLDREGHPPLADDGQALVLDTAVEPRHA